MHALDRFHVEQLLHKALDPVRRQEVRASRSRGTHAVLTKTRWLLLERRDNLTRPQAGRLRELGRVNLESVPADLLKKQFLAARREENKYQDRAVRSSRRQPNPN